MSDSRYVVLRRGALSAAAGSGEVSAPAANATITLWEDTRADRYKRLVVFIYSSHASAASGLTFDVGSTSSNPRNLTSYTVAAATPTMNYVAIAAPYARVQYANSNNTLTAFEFTVLGDVSERGNI